MPGDIRTFGPLPRERFSLTRPFEEPVLPVKAAVPIVEMVGRACRADLDLTEPRRSAQLPILLPTDHGFSMRTLSSILSFLSFFLLVFTLAPVHAQESGSSTSAETAAQYEFAEGSEITVSGGSTIHDWSCTSESISGSLTLTDGSDPAPSRLQSGSLRLPVESLTCTRDRMNDNTWEALKYEDHPEIQFELQKVTATADSADWTLVEASGELTVSGATESIDLEGRVRGDTDGSLQIRGEKGLTMTMFDIEPPTALFGTIEADDEVTVSYEVRLTPANAPSASR